MGNTDGECAEEEPLEAEEEQELRDDEGLPIEEDAPAEDEELLPADDQFAAEPEDFGQDEGALHGEAGAEPSMEAAVDTEAIDNLLSVASAAAAADVKRPAPTPRASEVAKRPRPAASGRRRDSVVDIDGVNVDEENTCTADLRFHSWEDAAKAMFELHGSTFQARGLEPTQIAIVTNDSSKDSTKLVVHGLPLGVEWQELKDYFKRIGPIAYVAVRPAVVREETVVLTPGTVIGEVRYDAREHAQRALEQLDGSILAGAAISLVLDGTSKDGTKLFVSGIPLGVEWQELKDHFSPIGTVGYAGIKGGGKGGSKGGGKFGSKGGVRGGCKGGGCFGAKGKGNVFSRF